MEKALSGVGIPLHRPEYFAHTLKVSQQERQC
jgi:hypothetical protein